MHGKEIEFYEEGEAAALRFLCLWFESFRFFTIFYYSTTKFSVVKINKYLNSSTQSLTVNVHGPMKNCAPNAITQKYLFVFGQFSIFFTLEKYSKTYAKWMSERMWKEIDLKISCTCRMMRLLSDDSSNFPSQKTFLPGKKNEIICLRRVSLDAV